MSEQEKKRQRINDETKEKISLWSPIIPLIMLYGSFLKTNQMQLFIHILIRFRLLLRRNGIKCLKNVFTK